SVRTIQAYTRGPDVTVTLTDDVPGAAIHYTLDGSTPSARSLVYGAPLRYALKPNETVDVTAVAVLPDGRVSTPSELLLARR
ncbi:MAG: chitobiase/beta-hexosaminidase C-terminal domain-containing protein, partial [Vulcanimicrobiaceae bacterium]